MILEVELLLEDLEDVRGAAALDDAIAPHFTDASADVREVLTEFYSQASTNQR